MVIVDTLKTNSHWSSRGMKRKAVVGYLKAFMLGANPNPHYKILTVLDKVNISLITLIHESCFLEI